jgi:hypothetical protein
MVRVLGISDIHGNLRAVQALRAQEQNRFDGIILAGDIGPGADAIVAILSSFRCPVLYVFGNWDGGIDYDHSFGPDCYHLHHDPMFIGSCCFIGYSGIPDHWGKNPIAAQLMEEFRDRHRALLARYDAIDASVTAAEQRIQRAYEEELAALPPRRRTTPMLRRLERTRDQRLRNAQAPRDRLEQSNTYKAYQEDGKRTWDQITILNRQRLAEAVNGVGRSRAVVVTHDRLYRTKEDFPGVQLFLFGHRHGFTDTTFARSRYVNISALDMPVTLRPARNKNWEFDDCRNINMGNYVIMELDTPAECTTTCVRFTAMAEGWVAAAFLIRDAPWL